VNPCVFRDCDSARDATPPSSPLRSHAERPAAIHEQVASDRRRGPPESRIPRAPLDPRPPHPVARSTGRSFGPSIATRPRCDDAGAFPHAVCPDTSYRGSSTYKRWRRPIMPKPLRRTTQRSQVDITEMAPTRRDRESSATRPARAAHGPVLLAQRRESPRGEECV
jgi:hypothetical protein